ncbi:RNA polymerase sigma factor [Paenibacillus rhizovicinus]|uniref:RNA polymerase sigma factor n=1 Tax=Paenibacillus rhizovicinus TaxID=2704463 RepID=A0A6C0NUB9_9BACL|nr:RNA polymerase sigma factor [Paenibacillus rhizovicinus]QHW29819.1 RNA polymerase sigma factor [Paenibacillus rhizovicinus]
MNKDLFRELYAAHSKAIYSYLFGRTNHKELAADLLQDSFLKIWNRIEIVAKIPPEERLYWIFSIASNGLKDHYRRSAHRNKVGLQLKAASAGDGASAEDLSGVLAGRERLRDIETHINGLPEELRCILLMKVLGELSSAQIGIVLNQPPGTIRYKIAQARRLLAEKLKLLESAPIGVRRTSNE